MFAWIHSWLGAVRQRQRELRSQVFFWVILPLMIVLVIIFLVNLYAYQQVVESLVKARNQELARTSATGLSQSLQAHADILHALASTDEVRSGDAQRQHDALMLAHGVLEVFDGGVFILNRQGLVTASDRQRPDVLGQNLALTPYFQNTRALRSPTFSDIVLDPGSRQLAIVIATPILDRDGSFQGVLMGLFRLLSQNLGRQLRELEISGDGLVYITDRNGRVIFHTDYNAIGRDYSDRQAVDRLTHGEDGGAFLQVEEGQRFVISFARVASTGWGLVIRESWAAVIAPTEPYLRFTLIALFLGFSLATVMVTLTVRRVTGPIADLVKSTTRVARGDFSSRVQESNIKEIGELGRSFNFMIDQIARYRASMRRYVVAITHSQEDERKRIARDLHDDTVQSMVAIGQRLDLCRAKLADQEDITQDLTDLRKMVTATVNAVRQFSRDLRPLALEDLGLVAALHYLVNEMSNGVQCSIEVKGNPGSLARELEIAIYRIVQETLQNVRKHAQASRVAVRISFTTYNIEIQITDNGRGFVVPENLSDLARQGNFGVMGIEERVKLFGGAFHIASKPDEGTRVSVILPREFATDWEFPEE